MRTRINNHTEIGAEKNKAQKLTQIQKLQTGLKTDDLSSIRYTGKCDALGGTCACGKKGIVYRFFVVNPDGDLFIVGSECITHFAQTVQNDIKSHERQLKAAIQKKHKDEEAAYRENAEHNFCIPLNRQLQELCSHPLLVGDLNLQYMDFNTITRRREYYYDRLKVMREVLKMKMS